MTEENKDLEGSLVKTDPPKGLLALDFVIGLGGGYMLGEGKENLGDSAYGATLWTAGWGVGSVLSNYLLKKSEKSIPRMLAAGTGYFIGSGVYLLTR